MNLYLVLAVVLGVTAPTVSPRISTSVAESRVSAQRSVQLAVRRSPLAAQCVLGQQPTANGQPYELPLTGGGAARAPAYSR